MDPLQSNFMWQSVESTVKVKFDLLQDKTLFKNKHVIITQKASGFQPKVFVTGNRIHALIYFVKSWFNHEKIEWRHGNSFEQIKEKFTHQDQKTHSIAFSKLNQIDSAAEDKLRNLADVLSLSLCNATLYKDEAIDALNDLANAAKKTPINLQGKALEVLKLHNASIPADSALPQAIQDKINSSKTLDEALGYLKENLKR